MSRALRGVIGAIIGALIVLAVHPKSRPYILGTSLFAGRAKIEQVTQQLPENLKQLPKPEDIEDASLWLQKATEQIQSGKKLSVDQSILLAEIAQQGKKAEPDNAFWFQMESVFLDISLRAMGKDRNPTLATWIQAGTCTVWNDHQGEQLQRIADELDGQTGTRFAWHRALAYSRRSQAVPQYALFHSRAVLGTTHGSLIARIANIRNGALIRDGAKSIQGAQWGSQMIDFASIDSTRPRTSYSPKTELQDEARLLQELASLPEKQTNVAQDIASNEAWKAFAVTQSFSSVAVERMRLSLLSALLPASLLFVGLIGLCFYLISVLLTAKPYLRKLFDFPYAFLVGVLLGVATFFLTGFVFASLWITATLSSFCIVPDRLRSGTVSGLGVVFRVTLGVLALGVSIGIATHLIECSIPVQQIGSHAMIPVITEASTSLPMNLAVLGISFVVATAPVWGYFYRFPASSVLPESLRIFGGSMFVVCSALSVVVTPFCLALDREVGQQLTEMLQNEPVHFMSHTSR